MVILSLVVRTAGDSPHLHLPRQPHPYPAELSDESIQQTGSSEGNLQLLEVLAWTTITLECATQDPVFMSARPALKIASPTIEDDQHNYASASFRLVAGQIRSVQEQHGHGVHNCPHDFRSATIAQWRIA